MAFQVKKGSFSFPNVTTPLGVTGVGFQPKAVIFWLTKQTATGYTVDKSLSIGLAASAAQAGTLDIFAADAQAATGANGDRARADRPVDAIDCAASSVTDSIVANFVSMDTDGFTIDPIVFAVGKEWLVHYLALGGSDLTNAFVGTIVCPLSASSVGHTGVGFKPDCVMILTTTRGALPADNLGHKLCLGAASSAADQAVSYIGGENVIPTNLQSIQKSGEIIHTLNFGGTDNTVGSLLSFDNDGFTIDYTVVPGTARTSLVLALKGGQYKVATDTQRISTTGTKAKTGIGFQPVGLLTWGSNRASSASADATLASFSIGASDGSIEGTSWAGSADNVSTTDENACTVTDKILRHATVPSTTDAEADLQSFDSDGYTLNWTTVLDAVAREFIGLSFGNSLPGVNPLPSFTRRSRGTSW